MDSCRMILVCFVALALISSFQMCLADCDALLTRIEALEKQGKQQQDLLREQDERLLQQEETITELLQWKERQLQDQPSRTQPVDRDKVSRDQTKTGNKEADGVKDVTKITPKQAIARPNRIVLGEAAVAFHAVIATNDDSPPMATHQKIVFDHVNLNLGNGYHNLHGLFIVPVPGLYMFSTSVMSHGDEFFNAALVKNGVTLSATHAQSTSGTYDQGSVSVVAQLAVGDEIWVQHGYGNPQILHGNYYTSFMGVLIMPL